ncbi:unnamed protein product [Prunus armeniaca]|uniref:Uncharacterized protein n=1 Tax=Prunus armeniaca TaxID=36596 RepID=A0A6J5U1J4_PRUAR|nr:unnamed protein product [Prunus armeniaca]
MRKLGAPSEKQTENKLVGEHATIQKANRSLTRSPNGKEDINIPAQCTGGSSADEQVAATDEADFKTGGQAIENETEKVSTKIEPCFLAITKAQ